MIGLASKEIGKLLGSQGVNLNAVGLHKQVSKNINSLQDISLSVQAGEMVAIIGKSDWGRSTLLRILAGASRFSSGCIQIDGVDTSLNTYGFCGNFGFVPAEEVFHPDLTVEQVFNYTAQLRLPRQKTSTERHVRIREVAEALNLTHVKQKFIHNLSGEQKIKLTIALELLNRPGLLCLEEPISNLDLDLHRSILNLLRCLADQGCTVILSANTDFDIHLVDKVAILAESGFMVWYGSPQDALSYFSLIKGNNKEFAPNFNTADIFGMLEDQSFGSPKSWNERYCDYSGIRTAINGSSIQDAPHPTFDQINPVKTNLISPLKQLGILVHRQLALFLQNRSNFIFLLLITVLVGSFEFVMASIIDKDIFGFEQGSAIYAAISLFLLSFYILLAGVLSQIHGFRNERAIYLRERMAGLNLPVYVASKFFMLGLLAIFLGIIFSIIRYWAFTMPGGVEERRWIFITLTLSGLTALLLGLVASLYSTGPLSAGLISMIFIIPNIIFSNVLVALPEPLPKLSTLYWSFKGFAAISGLGADIASDDCWLFPDQLRKELTLEDKEYYNCQCMGLAMFNANNCDFPGIGKFIAPEIYLQPPVEPFPPNTKPPEPILPNPPKAPENQDDQSANGVYFNALSNYQEQISDIQKNYNLQVISFQLRTELYRSQMATYLLNFSAWKSARSLAVNSAEGEVAELIEKFGWAFVIQEERDAFKKTLILCWLGQFLLALFLIIWFTFYLKRLEQLA